MRTLMKSLPLAAALCVTAFQAQALSLTADAIANGFTLSLTIDSIPASGYCCGPLGIATNSAGQIVMQDYPNGANYVFANHDGQHFSDALSSAAYWSYSYGAAIANSGGQLYATNNDYGGVIFRLESDGTKGLALTGTGAGGHGLWTNPATGHLVAGNYDGIRDIDPATSTVTQLVSGIDVDGVSVSPDGTVVYAASGGHVYGWKYNGDFVYDSGYLGSPDGTGVIMGSTPFAGDIVANANDGTVWLLNPTTGVNMLLATGGTRGDYVGVDNTNGSLFLTQTDSVYRLTCGADCTFTNPIPEPDTLALAGVGLGLLGVVLRRRRVRPA